MFDVNSKSIYILRRFDEEYVQHGGEQYRIHVYNIIQKQLLSGKGVFIVVTVVITLSCL